MIDDRNTELLFRPVQRIGIGALAGEKQCPKFFEIVVTDELPLRVLLLDGAKCGRRSEHDRHLVLCNHPPECSGVRRADGLAFVEDGRVAVEQRRIDDVGVADDPADIGCRPVHFPGLYPIYVLHAPFECDDVAAVVTHHALGLAGGSRRVQDVERIRGSHGNAIVGRGGVHLLLPIEVAAGHELGLPGRALHDDALSRFVCGERDGVVQQRLVVDDSPRLDAAGCRYDHFRLRVVDAHRELVGGEPAEHHRVHRAKARARQHRDHRLGNHGHIDKDAIAFADALGREHAGEVRHLVPKLAVTERLDRVGYGTVVYERRLIGAAVLDVHVEGVVAGIGLGTGEPAIKRLVAVIQHRVPGLVPVHVLRRLSPERLRVADGARINVIEATHHGPIPVVRDSLFNID